MDTRVLRDSINGQNRPHTESEIMTLLLCDILDELRKNAENRKAALGWNQPPHPYPVGQNTWGPEP